jgi:hypothetical protein
MVTIRSYLISISIHLIFISGLFAQETKTISGVVTDEIQTKNGKIIINRTTNLPRGKTVSGTVTLDPETDDPGKAQKRLKVLRGLTFRIGNELILKNGIFTIELPDSEYVPLQVFSPEGVLLKEIPLTLSEPVPPAQLILPKTVRSGFIERINGDFPGDISEVKVTMDNAPVDIIAGNETELFFQAKDIEPGIHELALEYGDVQAIERVNLVDYSLQTEKSTLNRGESTYLDVNVAGLEDIKEPLVLELQNQSQATVFLEGGNSQIVEIIPKEVAEKGDWQKRFEIQSLRRGSYSIVTDLYVPEQEKLAELEDTIMYMEEESEMNGEETSPEKDAPHAGSESISPDQLEALKRRSADQSHVAGISVQKKRCLRYPTDPEINDRVGWDPIGDLYRVGKIESDYLTDLRGGDIRQKLQNAKLLSNSLQNILNEDHFKGHKCKESMAHADRPQQFPEFPWDHIFLSIDICDEANEGKDRLIDFLHPDSDIEALKKWRKDFESAIANFGLPNTSSTSMLNSFSSITSNSMSDIDKAYNEFQENMRVTLELRYNASRARANMWKAVSFTVGTVLSAGIGGAIAGTMGAALVSTFVSTAGFVYEQGLETLGMDSRLAQLVSSIVTAGMGGFPSGGDVVNMVTTGTVTEGLNTMQQGYVESYAMSMVLLDDHNWGKMIEKLKEDYRPDAIARFNENRDEFVGKVREELVNLCQVKNSLNELLPETEEAVDNAQLWVSSSFWRKLWNNAMNETLDCNCCEWSDGSNPPPSCIQLIPPFGFSPDELDK